MSDSVTNLLNAVSDGRHDARDELLPLIYQELRVVFRSRLAARRQLAEKRGGGRRAVTLAEQLPGKEREIAEVVALDAALEQLQELDPALAKLVELRFFLGLSVAEVADLLGASERTLARDWQKARAFLHAQLDG